MRIVVRGVRSPPCPQLACPPRSSPLPSRSWAFSTTGAVEGAFQLATGVLRSLSEQQLVACDTARNEGCEGGSPLFAMEYIEKVGGLTSEALYPFAGINKDNAQTTPACDTDVVNKPSSKAARMRYFQFVVPPYWERSTRRRRRLLADHPTGEAHAFSSSGEKGEKHASSVSPSAQDLDMSSTATTDEDGVAFETKLMLALIRSGPFAVQVDARSLAYYAGGVFVPNDDDCDGSLNHGALLVGFGVDDESGLTYWLVKNSWGDTWGEEGYLRLVRGRGACGITDLVVHSVV